MRTQAELAARRSLAGWAIRLEDDRATLSLLQATDGHPVAHLTYVDVPKLKVPTLTTCASYYGDPGPCAHCEGSR